MGPVWARARVELRRAPGGGPDLALGINPISSARGRSLRSSDRPMVLQGRLPDPEVLLEVAINETLAEDRALAPGDTLRMWPYAGQQLLPLLEGSGGFGSLVPDGQPLDLMVTAVVRHSADVSPNPTDDEVVYLATRNLFLTPAFHHRYLEELANFNQLVGDSRELRLHRGPADLPAFVDALRALPGGESAEIDTEVQNRRSATDTQRAIDLQAGAVLGFAVLVALAGTLVVGQVLARQVALEGADHASLRALGMTSGQLAGILVLRVALIGITAVPLAVVVAVALSPLGPLGLARAAEIDPARGGWHPWAWVCPHPRQEGGSWPGWTPPAIWSAIGEKEESMSGRGEGAPDISRVVAAEPIRGAGTFEGHGCFFGRPTADGGCSEDGFFFLIVKVKGTVSLTGQTAA